MAEHYISPEHLSLERLAEIMQGDYTLQLSEEAKSRIEKCRDYLDQKLKGSDQLFYGINTGFGDLCNVKISDSDIEQLQENLVKSHACGVGEAVPPELVKWMLFLKIQSLSYGHSGISIEVVERLIAFYNQECYPVVYQQGSLGASGDLAPLAHLSLPLLGLGTQHSNGTKQEAEVLAEVFNWQALKLRSKEGIALLNGTQFMNAYGCWCLQRGKQLLEAAELISAISLDGFDCKQDHLNARIHEVRRQKGQQLTAQKIRSYIEGSEIAGQSKVQVQDPYSFRCVPQVHGASRDVLEQVEQIFTNEINAVTDNPNIFPDEDLIVSGGNFHGQPLAIALDHLAIGLAELGNISERRTYLLLSGERALPPFLVKKPGLNSGLMIPQYTAASLVSQNKQLCTPASVDSITSSNGQEDHVSMGANGATKCYRVLKNLENILAIELLTAAQAMHFRKPKRSSERIEQLLASYGQSVTALDEDRVLNTDIEASRRFLVEKMVTFLK